MKHRLFSLSIPKQFLFLIVELFFFFSLFFFIAYLSNNTTRFLNISPHPFWIIILLVSVQYGSSEALFAAFLSTSLLYYDNLPKQKASEDLYSYLFSIVIIPLLWMIASLTIGEMRRNQRKETAELRKKIKRLSLNLDSLAENYEKLEKQKDAFEIQLASQIHTPFMLQKKLESFENAQDPLPLLKEIITFLLPVECFSLFHSTSFQLSLFYSFGWEKGKHSFSKSFKKENAIYKNMQKKKTLCSLSSKRDSEILAFEGIIAIPIIDRKKQSVLGMLKIEEYDFFSSSFPFEETVKTLSEFLAKIYPKLLRKSLIKEKIQTIESALRKIKIQNEESSYKIKEKYPSYWKEKKILYKEDEFLLEKIKGIKSPYENK